MARKKPPAKKEHSNHSLDRLAGRPHIPGYGIPKHTKGVLPWSHVTARMEAATHYWICTVDPDGRPHATPVDGVWLENQLYFGGSPGTRRNRNLAANPAVCVHLESGSDVVILHGEAPLLRGMDRSVSTRLSQASAKKYGYGPKPEEYEAAGVHVFRPVVVFAWKQFPTDATRWRFQNGGLAGESESS